LQECHPLVSIIVLNYNGIRFIEKCLKSLLDTDYPKFEVIFVDNSSTDGSVELVNNLFGNDPRLKIIVNPKNVGFALGNNIGSKYAAGKYLVFLNNDTEVDKSWLKELVKVATSDSRIGIVGCKVVTSFKGRAEALIVDRFGHSFPQPFPNSVREVFAVEGAAFLIKRDIWEKLGGFDPRYFALCEDIDLCWRAQLLGYRVVVAPNSIVFHVGSATVSKTSLLTRRYLDFRNSMRTLLKNYSVKSLLKLLPLFFALESAESIFISLKTGDAHFIVAYIKAAVWNIMNLKDTIVARSRIQSGRVIDDGEVMRRMMKTSAKLLFLFKYRSKLMYE